MAADADTTILANLDADAIRWLDYALVNVQTRSREEIDARDAIAEKISSYVIRKLRTVILPLTPLQAFVVLHAVREGRCRTGEEWLLRSRLLQRFEEYVRKPE